MWKEGGKGRKEEEIRRKGEKERGRKGDRRRKQVSEKVMQGLNKDRVT